MSFYRFLEHISDTRRKNEIPTESSQVEHSISAYSHNRSGCWDHNSTHPHFVMIRFLVVTETTSGTCLLLLFNRIAMSCLCNASLIHLACISGERYLAIKRPFAHITYVTESRLLASVCLWLASVRNSAHANFHGQ